LALELALGLGQETRHRAGGRGCRPSQVRQLCKYTSKDELYTLTSWQPSPQRYFHDLYFALKIIRNLERDPLPVDDIMHALYACNRPAEKGFLRPRGYRDTNRLCTELLTILKRLLPVIALQWHEISSRSLIKFKDLARGVVLESFVNAVLADVQGYNGLHSKAAAFSWWQTLHDLCIPQRYAMILRAMRDGRIANMISSCARARCPSVALSDDDSEDVIDALASDASKAAWQRNSAIMRNAVSVMITLRHAGRANNLLYRLQCLNIYNLYPTDIPDAEDFKSDINDVFGIDTEQHQDENPQTVKGFQQELEWEEWMVILHDFWVHTRQVQYAVRAFGCAVLFLLR
jgi:hypothetical protein